MLLNMEIIYRHFTTLPSTNDWAKANLATFEQTALTVISTDEQTAGRGRYNRLWIAPPGLNMSLTFVFFRKEPDPLALTRLLAETASQLLLEKGVESHIKWPNDLTVNQKKIAGILCETSHDSQTTAVILGIGMNVNLTQEHLSVIDQPATSIFFETGKTFKISSLIKDLAENFASALDLC